jgi:hypothetical protein
MTGSTEPEEEPRRWSRLRKLAIVNVLLVSGLGSLLVFFLSGGVTAFRVRLLVPGLVKGDVDLHPDGRPLFRGTAQDLRILGKRAIPALLPYARAEVASDDEITFRVLVLAIARDGIEDSPPDAIDLATDCLRSKEKVVREQALAVLFHASAPRCIEALLDHAEHLARIAPGSPGNRLYDDELSETTEILFMSVQAFQGELDARLSIEKTLLLDSLPRPRSRLPVALRQWLEANRSHLPRQAGSR